MIFQNGVLIQILTRDSYTVSLLDMPHTGPDLCPEPRL